MRTPAFCICENNDADQLRSNFAVDQRLCFCYTDSTIPLLPESESHLLWPYSLVCVEPGRKSRRQVFSQRDSHCLCHHNPEPHIHHAFSPELTSFCLLLICNYMINNHSFRIGFYKKKRPKTGLMHVVLCFSLNRYYNQLTSLIQASIHDLQWLCNPFLFRTWSETPKAGFLMTLLV